MRYLLVFIFIVTTLIACEKEAESVWVSYQVSEGYSPVAISFRNESGILESDTAFLESITDVWKKDLEFVRGDIVYLSALYADSASSANVRIITGGKVYKEASSVGEPDKYLIVSGVIPY